MSAFGLIYAMYLTLVVIEIWLIFRKEIIELAQRSHGLQRRILKIVALGVYDISDDARAIDRKVIMVLAALGIPAACILHGYVGFMFGSVKANAFWSTPLMPIIFLFSAVTSGIAMIIILYETLTVASSRKINGDCLQSLASYLWLFATLTVTLEVLEIVTLSYAQDEEWMVVGPLIRDKIAFSFIGVQMVFGSLIPFILLAIVVTLKRYLTSGMRNVITFVAAFILLIQVFSMRWNVVIGGQIFSKSGIGFRENYVPELGTREGLAMALLIFVIPFIIMGVFNRYLPLGADSGEPSAGGKA